MTGIPARVRPAVLSDADEIAAVHVQSWRETYTGLMPERFFDAEALQARRHMWSSILSLQPRPGIVAVAEHEGAVVGFAFAGSSKHRDAQKGFRPVRDLHLYSIYLLAEFHGAGTGHALLEAALGADPAQLWVANRNERARAFYENHGFRADGVTFADPDIDGLMEVRMVR